MVASPIKKMSHYTPEFGDGLNIAFTVMCALEGEFKCGEALGGAVYTKMTHDEVDTFMEKMVEQLGDEAWQFFNEHIYIVSGG